MIAPEQLARYRASARRREAARKAQRRERQQQGLAVARWAAQLLKQEFGVTRVRLFGSLLETRRVRQESDVDLAVEGLDNAHYLEALSRVLDLSAFSVDLVQLESACASIKEEIERHGIDL